MTFAYVDTESLGLLPDRHELFEIAWALDDGEIKSTFLPHSAICYQESALKINHYEARMAEGFDVRAAMDLELRCYNDLAGCTFVGANPCFDIQMLSRRWGHEGLWLYRPLDVEVYAMGALGHDEPQGLARLTHSLRRRGWMVPEPDHTAAGDVATVRAAHVALRTIYARMTQIPSIVHSGPPNSVTEVEEL